jgi:RimJ/RimL family protein N-acetyltransferase
LVVREWLSFSRDEWTGESLEVAISEMLTPAVTRSLPPEWQGSYSGERARQWVEARDREGATLVVVERSRCTAIGLVILFHDGEEPDGPRLRLGYLLAESAWGKGLASELIRGFVEWCQETGVTSVVGGVERGNVASQRVLEKSGFVRAPDAVSAAEEMFILNLRPHRPQEREGDRGRGL